MYLYCLHPPFLTSVCLTYLDIHLFVAFSHMSLFCTFFGLTFLSFWPSEHVRGRVSGSRSGRENICSVEECWEELVLALTTGCATSSVTLPSWSIAIGLLLLCVRSSGWMKCRGVVLCVCVRAVMVNLIPLDSAEGNLRVCMFIPPGCRVKRSDSSSWL